MEKKKILTVLTAVVLFGGILFLSLQDGNFWHKKESYQIVILGDSVMGNARDNTSIPAKISQSLGVSVLNGAFGGSCATSTNKLLYASRIDDNLSMADMVTGIAYQDLGVISASVEYGMKQQEINRIVLPYFEETAEQLRNTDFDDMDILILAYGANDYNKGARLDNPQNPYDVSCFGGSLRYSIELIQKQYPDVQIVLATPVYCILFLKDGIVDCTERDFGGGYLEEYVELELQIGREYGLPVIDNYHNSGINRSNWEQYLEDGMHPNEAGRELLAELLAEQLKGLLN